MRRWDAVVEGRILNVDIAEDERRGILLGVFRHVGDHARFGLGYNFTDFSDDLTDLSYDHSGVFLNLTGTL